MKRKAALRTACAAVALGAGVLSVGAASVGPAAGAGFSTKVVLGQAVPQLPVGAQTVGALSGSTLLHLDVSLAGQDPSGLAAFVAAVSTPGSPQYRHYLSASAFASAFGPSADEVSQVGSALRAEGLTVGTPLPGSSLLPVSGTASVVSGAFATPLESLRLSHGATTFVNTEAPSVPSVLRGLVSGVVGLDGLSSQQSMVEHQPGAGAVAGGGASGLGQDVAPGAAAPGGHVEVGHAVGPQACSAASASASGDQGYTSTQLSSDFGLNQLFAQGRTGVGQTIGIVEFEQFETSDITAFEQCYGLTNPVRTVVVGGSVGGRPEGSSESALDIELAAVNAPSASILVYEAPNSETDSTMLALIARIASDDTAQVVSTSWGVCEAVNGQPDAAAESTTFQRMAAQGQTMIAAQGDAGSEDCAPDGGSNGLAVDDPGVQPDVVSVGGTDLVGGIVSTQTTWNNCQGHAPTSGCINVQGFGAGGGGYSIDWVRPSWQPAATGSGTDPCGNGAGCRSVPDFSGPADPNNGVVAYYAGFGGFTTFGGTSIVAPTTAGLFADTNQGCANPVGMVGPALYANNSAANYTDVKVGNNDFTDTNGGLFAAGVGYDAATGLGTPVDQNLVIALQGGDGCPSLAFMSSGSGPVVGGAAITITGGGMANATSVNFGSAGTGTITARSATSLTVVPPSAPAPNCVDVTVSNPQGTSAVTGADHYQFGGPVNCAGSGYRFVASDGGIFDFGTASFWGSTGAINLTAPIVAMTGTPSGDGYWLVGSDGGIFTFGDANFWGSTGGTHLNKPIVGMAATPNGRGYWLVASDGGIFAFGDAGFYGSTGGTNLNKPIVGMASTPDGHGYWLVASDGGIFTFGDADFYGSTGGTVLNKPIVGMAPTTAGTGYWLVASDGGIFAFGNANFFGSTGALHLNKPIVGMAASLDGGGYWLVAADGGIFAFGDAGFYGSTGAISLNKPIVGLSAV